MRKKIKKMKTFIAETAHVKCKTNFSMKGDRNLHKNSNDFLCNFS